MLAWKLLVLALLAAGCVDTIDDALPRMGYTCTTITGGSIVEELAVCASPLDIETEQIEIWDACHRACDVTCEPTWKPCGGTK